MADSRIAAVSARRAAREQFAIERAEQAQRDRHNEADLVDYLIAQQRIAKAHTDCESAVTAARDRRDATVTRLRNRQSECLRRMRERGEAIDRIAARTGLRSREVRKALIPPVGDTQARQVGKAADAR